MRTAISLVFLVGTAFRLLQAAPSLGEVALAPMPTDEEAATPELTTFRTSHLDDRGLNRSIRNISQPTLTIYLPDPPRHKGAMVICPGGAYAAVEFDREGLAVARYFVAQGLACAVLKYRLPAPLKTAEILPRSQQDALSAIRYLREHASSLGISPDRIGIMGFSAGGHLAGSTAFLGAVDNGSRPDFIAMLYPVVTMTGTCAHSGSRKNLLGPTPDAAAMQDFSLEQRAGKDWPPVFLVHAQDDKVVLFENSRLLAKALKSKGASIEWQPVISGGHGFALGRGPDSQGWKEHFLDWLDALP